jgi:hypothetical protein
MEGGAGLRFTEILPIKKNLKKNKNTLVKRVLMVYYEKHQRLKKKVLHFF